MSCSALSLALAENPNLTHVYYLAIHCRHCGDFRIGADQEVRCYPCPVCQRPSEAILLGEGGTVRPLPFWDRTEGKGVYREMIGRMLACRKTGRQRFVYQSVISSSGASRNGIPARIEGCITEADPRTGAE